jgi:hypothetical protein
MRHGAEQALAAPFFELPQIGGLADTGGAMYVA